MNIYETRRLLDEYLLFHYGQPAEVLPWENGPREALGFPVRSDTAEAQWQELLAQVGTMLVGLSPVLADQDGTDGKIIIAGPMVDRASAIELCARLDRAGVPCEPTAYAGQPVPLLN